MQLTPAAARPHPPAGLSCPSPRSTATRSTGPSCCGQVVDAVVAREAGTVGLTTGLVGAGGFGKTTLARMVAHDPRVQERFPDGVVWITVGADMGAPELAAEITSVARLFDGTVPQLTNPLSAGAKLRDVVAGRRVLLVVDDVWSPSQVDPFLGWEGTVTLFTTRRRDVLPPAAVTVPVDQMTASESAALLTTGLPALPTELVERVEAACGSWPLLLALVHGRLRQQVGAGADAVATLGKVLTALNADGITVLDVDDPEQRSSAVARTIELSLERLTTDERARYAELAARFGGDGPDEGGAAHPAARLLPAGDLPPPDLAHPNLLRVLPGVASVSALAVAPDGSWLATGGSSASGGKIRIWDAVTGELRHVLDAPRRGSLLVAPDGSWLANTPPPYSRDDDAVRIWDPGRVTSTTFLRAVMGRPSWLPHRTAPGSPSPTPPAIQAATSVGYACSTPGRARRGPCQWVIRRASPRWPSRPTAVGSPRGTRRTGGGSPLAPAGLRSRVERSGSGISALATSGTSLNCHSGPITKLAVAPDGSWFASGCGQRHGVGEVRIWDPSTGELRHVLTGHTAPVSALAVAPDGSWLASASSDDTKGEVLVWDPITGTRRATLDGHRFGVRVLVVSRDGTRLVTGDGTDCAAAGAVRLFDTATFLPVLTLYGHADRSRPW